MTAEDRERKAREPVGNIDAPFLEAEDDTAQSKDTTHA
jgi:hypothetical protein